MQNEVTVIEDGGVPAFADDSLLAIAKMAEARIDAVIKIKQLALKVTNASDWTDQQGKPYIQASGSEKIANLFNISVSFLTPEPLFEVEADGHYTYTFKGRFSMGGRSIEVEGSRSSRDPFFKQNLYENGKFVREKTVDERDNKRDVRMAAYTNLMGNGITRLLGIRNLTWEDLDQFAKIGRDQVGKVDYKTKGEKKEPLQEPKKKEGGKNGAPKDGAETATITVADITFKDGTGAKGAWRKYTITDTDKNAYGTFSETMAVDAKKAKDSGAPVKVTFKKGKYGNDLEALEIAVPDENGSGGQE